MKPLLVGEANPWQSDERLAMRYALHPDPPRASGGRLCFFVMGLDAETYLRSFDRVDLCHPKWSIRQARPRARAIWQERTDGSVIVCCGAKVAEAFGSRAVPFELRRGGAGFSTFVFLPHPSGLNRAWHVPGAVERARAVLHEAGVLPVAALDAEAP